jgi:hypothetical protein
MVAKHCIKDVLSLCQRLAMHTFSRPYPGNSPCKQLLLWLNSPLYLDSAMLPILYCSTSTVLRLLSVEQKYGLKEVVAGVNL